MNNALAIRNKITPDVWSMINGIAASMFDGRNQLGIVKQGEAAIKLLFCYENDLPLTAAVTGLYVVNGRLAVMSNLIAAKFKQHPNYDYKIKRLDNTGCVIEITKNEEVIYESAFTEKDANQAKLLSKPVWKEYPRNMYFGRAMTNGCRWYAPDLFNQPIYIPEELGMKVDSEGAPVVDGTYEVIEEIEPQITINNLADKYGADAILTANKGTIPGTQEDVNRVAEILAQGNSND